MALPRPPPRRPLTPVDQRIASIQERWLAGLQNSGRDLALALRAPSPICCRPPRAPANAVPAAPAPPPIPDLVVLGSAPAPSTEPPLLGTPLATGVFLNPVQGFSPVGGPSSSTSGVALSTGPMPQAVARAGSSCAPPPLSFPSGFSPQPRFAAAVRAPDSAVMSASCSKADATD
nr:U1 small nuclear ribonucleoprotein C-like [Aegilops tauschii subsp. strangulata]